MAKQKRIVTPEMGQLLRDCAHASYSVAEAAQTQLAAALTETSPIREGLMNGPILDSIYDRQLFGPGQAVEYPKSFLTPTLAGELIAVVCPNVGKVPQHFVVGDYVTVPTYMVRAGMNTALKYIRDARWDVVDKINEVVRSMWIRKANDDGWRTLIAAGVNRNLVVIDSSAAAGLFTKRLVAIMKTQMGRQAGGNTASINRGVLSDLYVSPEALEDMRSWDLTQIDDITRREIFISSDDGSTEIFRVRISALFELGVAQSYQLYYQNTLGGALTGGDQEVVVGLDLVNRDSFVNPYREDFTVYPDPMLHRDMQWGVYGWGEHGFGCLDNRRVLLGTF